MILNKDFKEFIESLNDHEVEYLVVGGYAVNFHGYPRYTKDIDFWINPSQKNLNKLIRAIHDFGFGSLNLTIKDFKNPDEIVQLGVAPNRIDLLTEVEGLIFEKSYSNKKQIDLDGVRVYVIAIEALITAKKASGRTQDMADAENLEKIKNEKA